MTVYEKKNSKGQGTGLWVVEVTVQGKRHRETTRDKQAADQRNAELTARPGLSLSTITTRYEPPAPPTYTVGKLYQQAPTVCWRKQKDRDRTILRFEAVCDILGHDTPLAKVRTVQLDDVVDTLGDRGFAPKTVHRYLAAFSGAMRWATSRDHIAGMPIFPWPECAKGKDTVLKADHEADFLRCLRTGDLPEVTTIAETLLATGARIGEITGLEVSDIDPKAEEVTFRDTKNGDDRTVPLQEDLARRLADLVAAGVPSYKRCLRAIQQAAEAAGVPYMVTPHVLRHTAGTRLSALGVSVPTIGRLLGHRSERTTLGYIHPEKETLKKAAALLRRELVE